MPSNYFEQSAATWDNEPRRIELMKAVGQAIVDSVQPGKDMHALDYGCGTGLVSLYLLPYVAGMTGADSSPGMLDMLRKKIAEGEVANMDAILLDLEHEPVPPDRYHMIVCNMTLHHIADTDRVLAAFHEMLLPGGVLCLSDLDTEPGLFHPPEAAVSVHHHGFDRGQLKARLQCLGFSDMRDTTAHTVRRPVADGHVMDFPVFLITARR